MPSQCKLRRASIFEVPRILPVLKNFLIELVCFYVVMTSIVRDDIHTQIAMITSLWCLWASGFLNLKLSQWQFLHLVISRVSGTHSRKVQAFPSNFLVRKFHANTQYLTIFGPNIYRMSVYGKLSHQKIRWKILYSKRCNLLKIEKVSC